MNMTSRDSTQVRPAETDGWEQGEKKEKYTMNLFEVLEDRYAYEGFNKFVFIAFFSLLYINGFFPHFAMLMILQDTQI